MNASLGAAPPPSAKPARYALTSEVARGGMGVVYRAQDKLANREVAYKRLLVPAGRPQARFVALFQREYNTLAQLTHPAIVDVYEYGFDEVGPFYTMELLDGKGLLELAPLPVREVCRVLRDTASALALLHARRLIHRDLSPANVRVNCDRRTKLIDFGALMPFGPAPDVVGTPSFMAPESFAGAQLDQRADLYALGALAYWALTRRLAVCAQSLDDLPGAWFEPIVPPSRHVPEIPAALEELVLSLLAQDPLARPASAAEVIERLTSIGDLEAESDEQVAVSYLAHPPLVGRDVAILGVEQALGVVGDKIGASLLVQAEQGQGKSALLSEVTLRAQFHGATVLRADAGADASSFGLARSLVRVALALYPDLLPPTGRKDSYFQQVLQQRRLARAEAAWSPVVASERQARTLGLMQEILVRASERNPLVLVVDELHRADAESLALIATLALEVREHALLLVLSGNEDALRSDAHLTIKAASRVIQLEALSLAQAEELINALFGGAANTPKAARWLHERSGGNPSRMMDLTRLLLQRKLIHYTSGTFTLPHDVPADLAWEDSGAALLGRLAGASASALACASVLSLQEMPLRLEQLAATLRTELREVVLGLEALTGRGIASVSEGRAALLNASLRAALTQRMSDAERRDLHLRCARAILAESRLDGSLRMQAGVHLLKASEEAEAVELLTARGDGDFLSGSTPIPLLETVLEVLRRQGRTDEQCLGVLVPLVRGGFFGDLDAQRRHIDPTLAALANVCGVSSMTRLTPKIGAKLAFACGLVGALIRHARTPKKLRYGTFPETVEALLSILSATSAAYASSFDAKRAFDIVRMFEPLRGFGPDSAPYWSMEFCLATAEIGAGHYGVARVRYTRLLERFQRPVKGMNDEVHLQFKQGILHGLAQCKVTNADPQCLALATELENAHMFFAPHAQSVRMGYYGYRGEADLSDRHRKLGEILALRGGISWSSATIMAMRSAYMSLGNNDTVGVLRGISELERLTPIAPKIALYCEVMKAGLELLRGRSQRAVEGFERVLAAPDAEHMIAHYYDLTLYAKALALTGRHLEARQVSERALAGFGPHDAIYVKKGFYQQIALVEAAQGNVQEAARILDDTIEQLKPFDNPLWSGLAHGDRARVALFAEDAAGYEKHARIMSELFHSTRNPALIQQCDQLQAAAQAQARGARSARVLDESAIAFETSQSRMLTKDDMDHFETEALPSTPPANQQLG